MAISIIEIDGTSYPLGASAANVAFDNTDTGIEAGTIQEAIEAIAAGGGGGDGLRKVYVNVSNDTPGFSNLDALHSAETSGVYQVIDQLSQKIIGILAVSSDNIPYLVTQWLFSTLVLSNEFSGSLTRAQYANGRAHIMHRFYKAANAPYDIPLNTWSEWKVYGLTLDELSEVLNSKANSADVYSKSETNAVIQEAVEGIEAGETVTINSDGANVVDSHTNPSILLAPSARQMAMVANNIEMLFTKVNDLFDRLAGIAFTDTKPASSWKSTANWLTPAIPVHGITAGALSQVTATYNGTALPATDVNEGEVTIVLTPASGTALADDDIHITIGGKEVRFTRSGNNMTFVLSGDATVAATAFAGITVNTPAAGSNFSIDKSSVRINSTGQTLELTPNEHCSWGNPVNVVVTYGGEDITSQCTIAESGGKQVITLPALSDGSKAITVTASAVVNHHITVTFPANHANMIIKHGNDELTGDSVVVYSDMLNYGITFEAEDGYRFTTAPNIGGTALPESNGIYTLTVNSVDSDITVGGATDAIPTYNVTVNQGSLTNCHIKHGGVELTLPHTFSGLAEGSSLTLRVVPDTDNALKSLSYTIDGFETVVSPVTATGHDITLNNITTNTTVAVTAVASEPTRFSVSLVDHGLDASGQTKAGAGDLKLFADSGATNEITNPQVVEGGSFTAYLGTAAASGQYERVGVVWDTTNEESYGYPLKVEMGGNDITATALKQKGTELKIEVAEVTDDITVTAMSMRFMWGKYINQNGAEVSGTNADAAGETGLVAVPAQTDANHLVLFGPSANGFYTKYYGSNAEYATYHSHEKDSRHVSNTGNPFLRATYFKGAGLPSSYAGIGWANLIEIYALYANSYKRICRGVMCKREFVDRYGIVFGKYLGSNGTETTLDVSAYTSKYIDVDGYTDICYMTSATANGGSFAKIYQYDGTTSKGELNGANAKTKAKLTEGTNKIRVSLYGRVYSGYVFVGKDVNGVMIWDWAFQPNLYYGLFCDSNEITITNSSGTELTTPLAFSNGDWPFTFIVRPAAGYALTGAPTVTKGGVPLDVSSGSGNSITINNDGTYTVVVGVRDDDIRVTAETQPES